MIGSYLRGWAALIMARFSDSPESRRRLRDAALHAQYSGAERLSARLERSAAEMAASAVEEFNREGLALWDQGEYSEAAVWFRKAVVENPSDYQALRGLATSHHQLGNFDDATYYYYSALGLDPNDVEIMTNLGLALTGSGREQEALDTLRRAAELEPEDPSVLKSLSYSLTYFDEFGEAADVARRVIDADESDPEAHTLLGDALRGGGDEGQAAESWKRSLELDPSNAKVNLALSALADDVSDAETTIHYAEAALELFSAEGNIEGQVDSLANLAWGLFLLRRHDEAEEVSQRAAALGPEIAAVWFNMGLNRIVSGDVSGAKEAYGKALEVTGLADMKMHGIDDLEALPEEDQTDDAKAMLEWLRQEYSERRRALASAS